MSEFADALLGAISAANGFIYTYFLVFALAITGLLYCVLTRFIQLRGFAATLKTLRENSATEAAREHLSPFEALMMSTASRVGIGNIAGISTAVVLGGAGALFWMWVMAFIGGASAFAESTLAQVYKTATPRGFRGGPAYYISRGLGLPWLGAVFSVILIITYAYGFNGLQSQTMTSAFDYYFPGSAEARQIVGIILTIVAASLFFSRGKALGKISSLVVPIMALFYVLLALIAVAMNASAIPAAVQLVLSSAFDWEAISGGFAGSVIVIGIKRGLFSNEAGMGSAPNAAAAAHTSHPVKQGLIQSFSVFIDLLICTCSGLLVIFSQAYLSQLSGGAGAGKLTSLPLVQAAMGEYYGTWGIHFITVAIVLFAVTSLIGNFYYAATNVGFLTPSARAQFAFRCTAVAMVYVGSQMDLQLAWELADLTMAAMASINIVAILLLSPVLLRVLRDYERQVRAGSDPHFCAEAAGVKNTSCWQ